MIETPEGWVSGRPSAETKAWAVRRQEWGDANKPNRMENVAGLQARARGFIAERFFHAFLAGVNVAFEAHGGADPLPDVEIARRAIGVRLSTRRSGTFAPRHHVYVFDDHLGHVEERFFVGYEHAADRYVLLGGVSELRVRARGSAIEKGDGLGKVGFVARMKIWALRIEELESPYLWIPAMLRRARDADAASITR